MSCALPMAWGTRAWDRATPCSRRAGAAGVPTVRCPPACAAGPAQQLPELISKETVRALEVRAAGRGCRGCRPTGGGGAVHGVRYCASLAAPALLDATHSVHDVGEHAWLEPGHACICCRPSWTMARRWLRCAASTTTWPRCPPTPGVRRRVQRGLCMLWIAEQAAGRPHAPLPKARCDDRLLPHSSCLLDMPLTAPVCHPPACLALLQRPSCAR